MIYGEAVKAFFLIYLADWCLLASCLGAAESCYGFFA